MATVIQAVPGMKERHLLFHWMAGSRTSVEEASKTCRRSGEDVWKNGYRKVEGWSKNIRRIFEEWPFIIVEPQKLFVLWQSRII